MWDMGDWSSGVSLLFAGGIILLRLGNDKKRGAVFSCRWRMEGSVRPPLVPLGQTIMLILARYLGLGLGWSFFV